MPFRVAFLEIDRAQPERQASLERPSDETIALALGHPLVRVQEIYRSLRSTNRSLFDLLVPAAHVLLGEGAALAMLAKEDALLEDAEIAAILVRNGAETQAAQHLIGLCRDAEGLDEVRRMLGIEFGSFNRTLSELGPPWVPLRFEERLKKSFDKRKDARRTELQQIVRDAFVAIFDADFLPPPDFLRGTIPHFVNPNGGENIGMVQTRWTYLNGDYSLLTRVETILLDGHFVIEHGGRSRRGTFFNFNGTAGVWRRAAIDSAGGWFGCRELLPVLLDWKCDESGRLRMQLALPTRPWQAFQQLASLRPSHTNGCNGR